MPSASAGLFVCRPDMCGNIVSVIDVIGGQVPHLESIMTLLSNAMSHFGVGSKPGASSNIVVQSVLIPDILSSKGLKKYCSHHKEDQKYIKLFYN